MGVATGDERLFEVDVMVRERAARGRVDKTFRVYD